MTKLRAAGFVIFRKVHQIHEFLLLQTSYGTHHWTPPKGHVDPGETDMEAAYRETEEESGLKKSDLLITEGFSKTLKYHVNGAPKSVVYWLAELRKDISITLSDEHQAFKWLPLEEACELVVYDEMKLLLKDCSAFLMGRT